MKILIVKDDIGNYDERAEITVNVYLDTPKNRQIIKELQEERKKKRNELKLKMEKCYQCKYETMKKRPDCFEYNFNNGRCKNAFYTDMDYYRDYIVEEIEVTE